MPGKSSLEKIDLMTKSYLQKQTELKSRIEEKRGLGPFELSNMFHELLNPNPGINDYYLDRLSSEKIPGQYLRRIHNYFVKSLLKEVPVVLLVGSYKAEYNPLTNQNIFNREYGHYIVITKVQKEIMDQH